MTIQKIVDTFHPELVVVFGSVSMGKADEHSDMDLLVVVNADIDSFKLIARMYKELANIRIPKNIIDVTPEEFEANCNDPLISTSEIVRTRIVAHEA